MRDDSDDPAWNSLDQESLLDFLFGPGIAPGDGASTPSPLRAPDVTSPADLDCDPADPDTPDLN